MNTKIDRTKYIDTLKAICTISIIVFHFLLTVFLPKTFILAALITITLCFITSLIALRKIDKYKLTEINTK